MRKPPLLFPHKKRPTNGDGDPSCRRLLFPQQRDTDPLPIFPSPASIPPEGTPPSDREAQRAQVQRSPPPTSFPCCSPPYLLIPTKTPSIDDAGTSPPRSVRRPRAMAAAAAAAKEGVEVVKGLDLGRYMGRWYEIASFPSWFQPRDGVNTRATYTLNSDGTVHVLNETWAKGKRVSIEGTAYKADPNSDEAKLKVKFYVPPFLPIIPVVGDYWVLYVDDGYQYAIVGEPRRQYLWILSRQTHMDKEMYNKLAAKAREEGYDVSKLHKTPQSDPPPEAAESTADKGGWWWIKSIFCK